MTGELSPMHWLIVIVVFMALFGAKKMPDAARGLGRSLRILKAELGVGGTATTATPATTPTATTPPPAATTTPSAAAPTTLAPAETATPLTYTAPTVVGLPAAATSPTRDEHATA